MRVAGGVIATIVGVIQTVNAALWAFTIRANSSIADTVSATAPEAAEAVAHLQDILRAEMVWAVVLLAVSLLTLIFGALSLAQNKVMNGAMLVALSIIGCVVGMLGIGNIFALIWPGLALLAGLMVFFGAGDRPATA